MNHQKNKGGIGMEGPQHWRPRLSFRSATIMMCLLNLFTVLLLLQGFLSSASSRSKSASTAATLRYVRESEEIRLAMQPLELIKRVREIQREASGEPETVQEKEIRQTVAVDLSKRLKDLRSTNDANSLKALEEWRKRKMERARLRGLEKNGTILTSQA
ncbi:uncharacterized protein LOC126792528 [Argentina anserina]|uniref:uncharacterized protein LOC126792528 n=1 Tax=Argentina anserina TaxID=57926 RepID=UPI0021762323|nr:uncharacterized protein LOC126792528 [Potentilla anserina]